MPPKSTNNKQIAKNTLYMYLRMLITTIISLYTSRIVLNVLGVVDFGIYSVVGGIVTLFIFLNGALSSATQRFIAFELGKNNAQKLHETFNMCMNVHVIITLLIIILAETIGLWLVLYELVIPAERMETAIWVYQCSVAVAALTVVQVPYNAAISAHERFDIYATLSIIDAFFKLGIVFLIQYLSGDLLLYYAIMILLAHILQFVLYRDYCRRKLAECRYHFFWNKNLFNQIFKYTSWSLIGNIADTLSDQGVNILLNIFFGPVVNAARGIAVQIKTQVSAFVTNFQSASNPQIVKLYSVSEMNQMINLVIKTSKISFFLFFLVMFPLCLEMKTILILWLKTPPNYLYEFSIIVLTTVLLQSVGGTLQMAIQASGKIKTYHLTVSITKLLCIPIAYIGLRNGASPIFPLLIVMAIYFSVVGINIYLVKKIMDFPVLRYVKEVIAKDIEVFCLSSIAPLIFVYFTNETLLRLPFTFLIATISICSFCYFRGFDKQERIWIKNLVISKILRA